MRLHEKELETAKQSARAAGEIIRASYANLTGADVSEKKANDMVTVVDVRSQEAVVSLIRGRFAEDFIVAEENLDASVNAGLDPGAPRRWYIDPLDGTTNYIHAYPVFAVSLAFEENGIVQAGVTYDPLRDELFSAARGGGAHLNDRRIRVSDVVDHRRALLATGFPFRARHYLDDYLKTFKVFFNNCRGIRRGGSAALDLAYVAAGRADAFWEFTLSPWDMAAGVVLVEEAAGRVTDFYLGNRMLKGGHIVASNGAFHDWMCKVIQEVFPEGTNLKDY